MDPNYKNDLLFNDLSAIFINQETDVELGANNHVDNCDGGNREVLSQHVDDCSGTRG